MKKVDRTTNNRNAALCRAAWLFCSLTALSSYIPTSFAADAALESSISQPTAAASSNNNRGLSDSTDFTIEFSTFNLQPRQSSLKGEKEAVFDEQQQLQLFRVLKGDEQSTQEPATNDEQQKQQLVLKRQQKQKQKLALKRQRGIQKRLKRRGNPPGINRGNKPGINRGYSNVGNRGNAPGINKRTNNNRYGSNNKNSNKNRWQNGGKPSGQPPTKSNSNWSSGKLCPCPTWQGTATNKWGGGRTLFHDTQSSWWGGHAPPNAWNNGWTNGWGRTASNNKWWGTTNNNWNNRSSNSWGVKWCACPTPKPTPRPTCEFMIVCVTVNMMCIVSFLLYSS